MKIKIPTNQKRFRFSFCLFPFYIFFNTASEQLILVILHINCVELSLFY